MKELFSAGIIASRNNFCWDEVIVLISMKDHTTLIDLCYVVISRESYAAFFLDKSAGAANIYNQTVDAKESSAVLLLAMGELYNNTQGIVLLQLEP